MNPRKKLYLLLALIALCVFALSCATSKANKFIEEGNAAVKEGEQLATEADTKITALAGNLDKFPENRDELKGTAQEIIDRLDKSIAKLREASSKFDEGSKTNLDAPLKEYLSLKSQEFSKHAEHLDVLKGIPNSVMDASIEDRATLDAKFAQIKERVDGLEKEWTDLSNRADKIQEQNKDKFKS
jgi:peptidoglycan hydrolase CwlO-like protein